MMMMISCREAKRNKESLDDYLYDEIDTGTQKKADVIDKNIHRWKWVIGEKLVTGLSKELT